MTPLRAKDFITIRDLSEDDILRLFALADRLKKNPKSYSNSLKGKSLGLVFQKPSNRTRVSFQIGMYKLGGNCIYLGPEEIMLGVRETVKDVARTLSGYLDGIVARTFAHQDIVDLARYAEVPVINGLSDLLHPCQVLSDLYTIREKRDKLKGLSLAYIGDGNNVLHSLLYGCSKTGINLNIATPKHYEPKKEILKQAMEFSKSSKAKIRLSNDPYQAVKAADIIYTDVWTSMGKEREREKRIRDFQGFQVNKNLTSSAKRNHLIMHCLPCHRGEEITDELIDGPRSIIFDQARNRLHLQKAILISLLK